MRPAVVVRVVLVCLLLGVVACNESDRPTPAAGEDTTSDTGSSLETGATAPATPVAEPGPIPATEQRSGDPAVGRRALLNEPYVSCGLPLRVFESLQDGESFLTAPEREGKAANLPFASTLSTNRDGIEVVSSNCLVCHGANLFGELTIGLGNAFADFTNDPTVFVERAGALVRGVEEIREWERFAERIAAIAPHVQTRTVGANPANNLTFALIAHRDPVTNGWSSEPLLTLPPTDPPPVSVPPWWRMQHKHALFNLGEGRGDHARIMMAASMLCTDNREELDTIDRYAADVRAYIASMKAPAWPFAVDTTLAEQGQALFEAQCAACHGTYGETPAYPNLLVDLDVVGTDPLLAEYGSRDALVYAEWFQRSWYGEGVKLQPGRGYVAPPLNGVWATGPFLHNGSVPDIASVLDSTRRPAFWRHRYPDGSERRYFNTDGIGWHHDALEAGKTDDPAATDNHLVYDTTLPGYGNQGHRFGDAFSEAERLAVLEYLKTL